MVEVYLSALLGLVWVGIIVYLIISDTKQYKTRDRDDDDDNDPPWTQFPPTW